MMERDQTNYTGNGVDALVHLKACNFEGEVA
jgi:hypothetical protein